MEIKKLKADFEKLKYVEEKLEYLNFDEHLGCYVEKNNGMPVGLAAWVNGAFYGYEQAKAQAIPDGFVLVPKEPTQAMYEAYARHSVAPMSTLSKTGYKAMLEAQEPAND